METDSFDLSKMFGCPQELEKAVHNRAMNLYECFQRKQEIANPQNIVDNVLGVFVSKQLPNSADELNKLAKQMDTGEVWFQSEAPLSRQKFISTLFKAATFLKAIEIQAKRRADAIVSSTSPKRLATIEEGDEKEEKKVQRNNPRF